MGASALALAVALSVIAVLIDATPLTRLLLAPLFFGGFVGVLQSRAHTCVALAAAGQCDLGGGMRRVQDAAELRAVRAKALRVLGQSALGTALATLVVLAIG